MTVAFRLGKMSSSGYQVSLDVSTLNHNAPCTCWVWPITAHHLLTSRLKSSADSIFHTECAGEQQLPTSTGNSRLCHPVSLHWKRDKGFPGRVQSCTPPVCAAMCLFLLIMCTVGPPSPPVQMGRCWKGVTHWLEQKGLSSGNMICCGRSYWP